MGNFASHLECSYTGEHYPSGELHNLSRAGRPLLVRYDLDAVRGAVSREEIAARRPDLWRWRELLPVRDQGNIVSFGEIESPLVPLPRAAGPSVFVKDESRLPTGSFKARGMSAAVSMAKELGVRRLALPTNGNAGGALSAYAARAGMECVIFCPRETPEVNLREMAAQGARVYKVDGLIDECGAIVARGAVEGLWFDISTLKEPYRVEGKKTMGLELALQLGWRLPDAIFYATGGGTALIGMWKAFDELEALGWIGPERPKMFAVQSTGCMPIVDAYEKGEEHADRWPNAATVASGIRVPRAIGDFLVLRAVRESGGRAIAVREGDILSTRDELAAKEGLLTSPEGATTLVAYREALGKGWVSPSDQAVLFNCATGLKYPLENKSVDLCKDSLPDLSSLCGN